jgi:hypothetical protein
MITSLNDTRAFKEVIIRLSFKEDTVIFVFLKAIVIFFLNELKTRKMLLNVMINIFNLV